MSASDAPGTVVQGARSCGKTLSLERTFIAQASARAREEACYAVVGPDSSDEFVRELREVVPVVVDPDARGVCVLIDGEPAEWAAGQAEGGGRAR